MTQISEQVRQQLTRLIAEKQVSDRVPGIVGTVVRGGETVWADAVGIADVERPGVPPTTDDQFLIASLSKTFTAVLVMQLRDAGKLDLDDTVDRFVPESRHAGITVRQMLSHVTGMQREPVGDVWDVLRYPDRAGLVSGWNEAEKLHRPHHRWHYSNLVYSLLGEIVARIDGRSWMESLQARVLDPLGLRRTTLGLSGAAVTGYYVPPYTDVPVREPVLDIDAMASAGGLASTAEDLAVWVRFLTDGHDEVLHPDTLTEMCQPQIMADLDRWTLAWGLGLMLVRVGDRVYAGHTGSMPGHITGMFVHRETGTGGICLMNATSANDPAGLATGLAGAVLDAEPPLPQPWTAGTEVPVEYAGLLGTWFSEGQAFVFSVRAGRLEARMVDAPAHQPPSLFAKLGDDLYRTESGREHGELLRITRDESGVPVKLNWATYAFTREPYAFGEWLH